MTGAAQLTVSDYLVDVHLGCTAEERLVAQEVRVSVDLQFLQPPEACASDRLADTPCYALLCDEIKQVAEAGEFNTVERLAEQIYRRLGMKQIGSESRGGWTALVLVPSW